MNIINFPDYNEHTKNRYYDELLKYFDKDEVESVKYSLEDNPAEVLLKYSADRFRHYDLIVGCGFGAILAIAYSRMKDDRIKTILINPMYPLHKYLKEEMAKYKYHEMFTRLAYQDICWNKKIVDKTYLILGRDDDVTDTARTAGYFYKENVHYADGGHFPQDSDFSNVFASLLGMNSKDESTAEHKTKDREQDDSTFDEDNDIVIVEADDEDDKYADLEIDSINAENGNFEIHYHTSTYGRGIVYLYFNDGKWKADIKDGLAISSKTLAAVLEKAIPSFVETVELKERLGDSWGLMVW